MLGIIVVIIGGGAAQRNLPHWEVHTDDVYARAYHRYVDGLNRACSEKRLDLIAPGELPDHMDDFEQTLRGDQKARLERAAARLPDGGIRRCDDKPGASCGNVTRLAAYNEREILQRFVRHVCALPEWCVGQSDCRPTRR